MNANMRDHARATFSEYRAALSGVTPVPAARYLICGMGASAIPAEVLADLWGAGPPEITVCRTSLPPLLARERLLQVVVSFSGNTAESLETYVAGRKRIYTRVTVGKGGNLESLAEADGVSHYRVPGNADGRPARACFGALLGRLMAITDHPQRHVDIDPFPIAASAAAEFASTLAAGTTTVIAPPGYWGLARRFSANLNENSKLRSFSVELPEFSHNLLQGIHSDASPDHRLLILRSADETAAMQARIDQIVDLLSHTEVVQVPLQGQTPVSRTLYGAIFSDLVSIAVAEAKGIEAAPTPVQEELKRRLS